MVKICKTCSRRYSEENSWCGDCDVDLSCEELLSDNASHDAILTNEASKTQPGVVLCPTCNADIASLPACPRCKKSNAGYKLCWQDVDLEKTLVTGDQPVFIGRVSPVDKELARRIEERFPFVSRIHAEIYMKRDGNLYLRDMNSMNGTYINNQRVAAYLPQKLKKGDMISFSNKLSAVVE